MTAVIKTLIETWAKPRMNAHEYCIGATSENIGSHRVFEKNGFKFLVERKDEADLRSKGGGFWL